MASVQIGDDSELDVTLRPKDAAGQTATLDGPAVWESGDPAVCSVVAIQGDGLVATIRAAGLGTTQVKATGDADPSSGVRPLVAVIDVTVGAGEAQTIDVVLGAPRAKTPAQP